LVSGLAKQKDDRDLQSKLDEKTSEYNDMKYEFENYVEKYEKLEQDCFEEKEMKSQIV